MSLSALKISELPDYSASTAALDPNTTNVDFVVNVNNNTYRTNLNSLQKLQKLELTQNTGTALVAVNGQINNLTAPTLNSTNATITNLTAPTINSSNATITSLTGNVLGTVTGNLSGQAVTANTLHTNRNFTLSGDITGTVSSNLLNGFTINTQIEGNRITNSNISPTATIEGTKITPTFGSQNITTTGNVSAANITTTGNVSAANITTTGNVSAANITITGNAIANNLVANGNAFITNLVLGTQPNKATINYITNATRTFTIPNVAGSDFVMTAGDQIIGGNKIFTATIQGSIDGNAGTATTLQTTRTIWGNSFNGSGPVNGALELPNGSVSSPALTFANDVDTGIFKPTSQNNVLNIATGSETRVQVDSTGGVWEYQETPKTYGADQTLSNSDLQAKIIILDSTAGGNRTFTMPDKTTLDNWSGGAIANQMGFDFTIINESATRTVTLAGNTNVTRNQPSSFYIVQSERCATFRLRNIGSGYIVYCLSRGI